ncbi:MAG TPA: hypothetical protein VFR46_01345, partial [Actinomycetes bacterium]|nr:hypothetical protein [Actinomycetes bacterium]
AVAASQNRAQLLLVDSRPVQRGVGNNQCRPPSRSSRHIHDRSRHCRDPNPAMGVDVGGWQRRNPKAIAAPDLLDPGGTGELDQR